MILDPKCKLRTFKNGDWYHIEECDSTQNLLRSNQETVNHHNKIFALSAKKQLKGIGRADHSWNHYEGGIAISVILPPLVPLTVSSLHMGLLIKDFITQHWKIPSDTIGLKWPNDIMKKVKNDWFKIGGILTHTTNNKLIIGIGLNIYAPQNNTTFAYETLLPPGDILLSDMEAFLMFLEENWTKKIFEIKEWNSSCVHINKEVSLDFSGAHISGIFEGIGELGECIINSQKYYAGSLTIT
jgi:BirA family biotin operon repressor/biotin-[acetyl-CoA-carboxylase] ligase